MSPIKPDEIELMMLVISGKGQIPSKNKDELTKRDYAMLDKWVRKGQWEYGVSLRSGWLTPSGEAHLLETLKKGLKL